LNGEPDTLSQIDDLPDVGNHRQMIIHADNAARHAAQCVTESMDHNSLKRTPHPPQSPDLAAFDFSLFGSVKHQLQGHDFTKGAELVSVI
jgi:hypothetical protein